MNSTRGIRENSSDMEVINALAAVGGNEEEKFDISKTSLVDQAQRVTKLLNLGRIGFSFIHIESENKRAAFEEKNKFTPHERDTEGYLRCKPKDFGANANKSGLVDKAEHGVVRLKAELESRKDDLVAEKNDTSILNLFKLISLFFQIRSTNQAMERLGEHIANYKLT